MEKNNTRLRREKLTLQKMAEIYCRDRHRTGKALCAECRTVLNYAMERVNKCPFSEGKPVCSACPVHCHEPAMREKVRQIMRYAGPRMLLRHPLLSLRHFLDSIGKEHTRKK